MAGTTLQEILASRNLIGRVVDIVNGVPEDILPAGFLTPNRTTEGDRGEYLRIAGIRQTSTMSRYGAPAKHVAPVGIGSTPVKLIPSFEDFTHDPTILNLLIEETGTGLIRQQMAKETINRQLEVFGTRFRNLRVSAVISALTTGGIAFDKDGNLLPPDSTTHLINSGAVFSINFGVPSGNTGSLNVFGAGNLLTNWVYKATSNPTPGILTQLKAVKKAGRKLTGHPITHAFYGINIAGYIANDPVLQAIIRGSQRVAEETITAEIPASVGNLKWYPITGTDLLKCRWTIVAGTGMQQIDRLGISYQVPVNGTVTAMTIQVRNWQIRKTFVNADVTVTCSGGWREIKRVLASWEFTAEWPYDAITGRVGLYDGAVLQNNIWVPVGSTYPIPAACVFQIGAAGSTMNLGTTAIQYQGNALISSQGVDNSATDVVHFTISGQGTGALIGPVAGMIS